MPVEDPFQVVEDPFKIVGRSVEPLSNNYPDVLNTSIMSNEEMDALLLDNFERYISENPVEKEKEGFFRNSDPATIDAGPPRILNPFESEDSQDPFFVVGHSDLSIQDPFAVTDPFNGVKEVPLTEASWGDILTSKLDTIPAQFKKSFGAGVFKLGQQDKLLQDEIFSVIRNLPEKEDKSLFASASRFMATLKMAPIVSGKLPRLVLKGLGGGEALKETDVGLQDFGNVIYEQAKKDIKDNYPLLERGSAKYYASLSIDAIANMIPAIAATVATKNPAVGASIMGTQVYVDKYKEALDSGRSPAEAEQDALAYALFEAIPEKFVLGVLTKPGGKALTNILKGSAAEGMQEMFTEILQTGYDVGLLDEKMTWGEAIENLKDAAIVGAIAGGAMRAGVEPFIRGEGVKDASKKGRVQRDVVEDIPAPKEEPAQAVVDAGDAVVEEKPGIKQPLDKGDLEVRTVEPGATVRDPEGNEYVVESLEGDTVTVRGVESPVSLKGLEVQPEVGDVVKNDRGNVFEVEGISDFDTLFVKTEFGTSRRINRDSVTTYRRTDPTPSEKATTKTADKSAQKAPVVGDSVVSSRGAEYKVTEVLEDGKLGVVSPQGSYLEVYGAGMRVKTDKSAIGVQEAINNLDIVKDIKGREFKVQDSSDPESLIVTNSQGSEMIVPRAEMTLVESYVDERASQIRNGVKVIDKSGNILEVVDASDVDMLEVRDRHGKSHLIDRGSVSLDVSQGLEEGMLVRDASGATFTVVEERDGGRLKIQSKSGAVRIVKANSLVEEKFKKGSSVRDTKGRVFTVKDNVDPEILTVENSQGSELQVYRDSVDLGVASDVVPTLKKEAGKKVPAKTPKPTKEKEAPKAPEAVVKTPASAWIPAEPDVVKTPKKADLSKPYEFSGETEARIREAQKGLQQHTGILETAKGLLRKPIEGFSRRYEMLPLIKRWARVIRVMRRIEEIPTAAKEDADILVYNIVGKLKAKQYDDFALKVLVDDLMFQKTEGMPLPFGFTQETLEQAHADITARVEADHKVLKAVETRLEAISKLGKDLRSRKLLSEEQLENPNYFHRQVMEYAKEQSFIQRAVNKVKKSKKGFMQERGGTDKDHNANYLEAEFAYMREALESVKTHDQIMTLKKIEDVYDQHKAQVRDANVLQLETSKPSKEVSDTLRELLVADTPRKLDTFLKEQLGEKYKSAEDSKTFPEGYVEWQYDKGKWIYTALTVGERTHEALLEISETSVQGLGIDPEVIADVLKDIKKVAALGVDKPKFLIPEEVAHTLDNLKPTVDRTGINAGIAWTTRRWKVWRLFNPITAPRYFLNNFASDAEVILTVRPGILKELLPAIKELIDVHYLHKAPARDYVEARDEGVLSTGFTIQELPDINTLKKYDHLLKEKPRFYKRAAMAYWNGVKNFNQFRENWFRYAAFRYYRKRLKAGKKVGYEASLPQIYDQLQTDKERAALLSAELLGDYGNLSKYGQELRETWMPFFSWTEVNTKRYTRLISNAFRQGVGKGLARGSIVGTVVGTKITAFMLIRLFVVYGMINAWNYLAFPDEEDDLPDHVKSTLHVIYGVDEEGNTQYLHFAGALSDYLSWMGFSDIASAIHQIEGGNLTLGEYVGTFQDKLKTASNKAYQGLTPFAKSPVEWTFEVSTFPDVWKPRGDPTPYRSLAQVMEFQAFYDIYSKYPSKGFYDSTIGKMLLVSKSDPEEVAYYKTRELMFKHVEKDKATEGFSTQKDNVNRALSAYRKSLRLKDIKAQDFWKNELKLAGVSRSDISERLKSMHPLARIPKKDRHRFKRDLTDDQKSDLKKAMTFYDEVYR